MATLHVYCQPGAKQTQVCGRHDGRIKIQLKAPPVEGAANKALIDFLAKQLKVPKASICIESGELSRLKRVRIDDDSLIDPEAALLAVTASSLKSRS